MAAEKSGMECLKSSSDHGHPLSMGFHEDRNSDDPRLSLSNLTRDRKSIDRPAPDPVTKKPSLEERLDRLSKYRVPTAAIVFKKPIGRGGKAEVVQASFSLSEGGLAEDVAVKKLLRNDTTHKENFSKEFVHEVEMLARLSHKNVIQLVGFVEELQHNKAWIVLSWESNGNPREFLASGKWEIPERISLIQDMFEGLEYIHTHEPPICHGDLKSLNILVSSSFHAVITDFGSARLTNDNIDWGETQDKVRDTSRVSTMEFEARSSLPEVTVVASANQLTLTGPVWSLRWAAPEIVKEETWPGLASDIWSVGWVCWEMMTDKVPFEDLKRDCAIMLKVVQGTVPMIHEDAQLAQVMALCSLMTDCWKFEPEKRPHVVQCCNQVKWMPSVPPFGGQFSGTKELSPRLLLKMGYLHYSQGRYGRAASLLEQVVASCESAADQEVAEALDRLGDIHRAQCRYTQAVESFTQAREIYARIGDDRGQANVFDGLGDVYRAQCKYVEAEDSYIQAQETYTRIGNDLGLANTVFGLAHVYHAQSKYAKAEGSYARAEEIYTGITHDLGRANTALGLGDIYRARCRYTEAEESYLRGQALYARIGHNLGQANASDGLGDVYHAQCKHTEAEQSYTSGQEIYARIGDDLGLANTVLGLAHVYRAQSKYTDARGHYARAEGIYTRIGDDLGRANALHGLGELYFAQCQYSEAKESLTEAREIYGHIGNEIGRANTLLGLAHVYRIKGKYTEAGDSYTGAQEMYARIGDDLGRANTIRGLGDAHRAQCKYVEAGDSYARAQEIYTRIGDELGRANTLDGLGDAYCAQCRYTEAEEFFLQAQEIYARIDDDNGRADTLVGLGDVYRAQCKYAEAERLYLQGQEVHSRIGDVLGQANALYGLGHLHRKQGLATTATPFYAAARDLYSKIGNLKGKEDASCSLALLSNEDNPHQNSAPSQ